MAVELDLVARLEQRQTARRLAGGAGRADHQLAHALGVGPHRLDARLRPPQARAATSSIAFVILRVLRTERIRRLRSCWEAIASAPPVGPATGRDEMTGPYAPPLGGHV